MNSYAHTFTQLLTKRAKDRCPDFSHLNENGLTLFAVFEDDQAPGGVDIGFSLNVPSLHLALKAARNPGGERALRDVLLAVEARFDDALEEYIVRRYLPQRVRESAYR